MRSSEPRPIRRRGNRWWIYRALYGEYGLWVRPAAMWNETVDRDGYHGPRFQYIGDKLPENG